MSIPSIITTLEKLITLHAYLYELTVRKEGVVKENKLKDLQELTKEERKFTKAIFQLEQQRLQLSSNKTVSDLIDEANSEEKTQLLDLKEQLSQIIADIQKQNELNQMLLNQSMQFVTMTMNTLHPQSNAVTYEKSANLKKSSTVPARSMFDSKA